MSNAVGRWLTNDVTMDLKAVSLALRKLTAAERDLALPRGVALREVADVTDAFRSAMAAFADQAISMREATLQRRQAERNKSRFLAHLSHELKPAQQYRLRISPELDGPIEGLQREQLANLANGVKHGLNDSRPYADRWLQSGGMNVNIAPPD